MLQRRTLAIAATCAGGFLAFLDTTIVNVSFPSIAESFPDAERADLSWVLDAYFIVIAALLVPAGAIADRYGRKRVFLIAIVGFVLTSILCAVAPTWELLVGARALQGASAAVLTPVSMALMLPEFTAARRATGVGIWGAAAAFAAAAGPPLGGVIVHLADWRWIFLVNVPIGLVVLVIGRSALLESVDEEATGLPDLLGAALTILGLGVLALAIVEGGTWGWSSPGIVASFVIAAVLSGVVAWRCSTHPRPIIDPELLRVPSFRDANIATLLFAMAFFSTLLGNILFLTSVWQFTVLAAGLAVLPGPLASTVVAGPAGRLADRFGHRAVIVPGVIFYVAGLLVLRSAGLDTDYVGVWLPGQILTGIGIGLAFPTLGAAALTAISQRQFGTASAVSSAFRQFGAVLGTAILVAIVGSPLTLAAANDASDRAYIFSAAAALAAGLITLTLRRIPEPKVVEVSDPEPLAAR
ncbi:DHA2 family efflux MFS transporter permease subunit [Antrihabitans sp. YC2-6]|uniref:DHA2 family efflux MFS transporter permease subunit n=1 Tax=Antrihabitans sp. YC2-6 TaxID=2799498 RepID=UPI001F227FB6|nr:DHA2 family efflux MFS transporter permease subunit [Antrihabitans sp. YC2-6]